MRFFRFFKIKRIFLIILLILIILILLFWRSCLVYEDKKKPTPLPIPTPTETPTPTPIQVSEIIFTVDPGNFSGALIINDTPTPTPTPGPIIPSVPTPTTILASTLPPIPTITQATTYTNDPGIGPSYIMRISGPGNGIFNISDGFWWPGRILEKSVEIKNIGNLPLDLTVSCTGNDKPSLDEKGDGANVSLKISWSDGTTDKQKWRLAPGQSQKINLRAELPSEADNSCQGDIWNLIFTFYAKE